MLLPALHPLNTLFGWLLHLKTSDWFLESSRVSCFTFQKPHLSFPGNDIMKPTEAVLSHDGSLLVSFSSGTSVSRCPVLTTTLQQTTPRCRGTPEGSWRSYLLQQLLGSVQFLPVMLQAGVQVTDLLTLHLHLICEDTHLENGGRPVF